MSTATQNNGRFRRWRWEYTIVVLLLAIGILITPIQWYRAYIALENEKRRRRSQVRERNRDGAKDHATAPVVA